MVAGKNTDDQGLRAQDGIRKGYADPLADWAKIRNVWARDRRLGWDSLGLLTWLSTHADGFHVGSTDLYNARIGFGRHRVDEMIKQLEQYGYLRRVKTRSAGKWTGTTWELLDPDPQSV